MKYFLIFFIGLILTSCSQKVEENDISTTPDEGKKAFEEIINKAPDVQSEEEPESTFVYTPESKSIKEVKIPEVSEGLVTLSIDQNEEDITILLSNPSQIKIQSVRTWISFPPGTLQVSDLKINDDIFDLLAPGELNIDSINGLVKIGAASTSGTEAGSLFVASFKAKNISNNSVPITCYNFNSTTDSKCLVLGADATNILKEPQSVLLNR